MTGRSPLSTPREWQSRSNLSKAGWYFRHGYVSTAWLFLRFAWEARRA